MPDRLLAADYLTGDAFTVCRTVEGWWKTTPQPSDMARYYPPVYYGERPRRFPAPVEWLQNWLYSRRVRAVSRAVGRAGRVLDVGCGPGHLLARFQREGWSCVGTEITAGAASIPRERYGLDVRVGNVEDLALAAASFDAVVSWHTLEHMNDPSAVLDEIARVLTTGGVALISVPNFSSPEAQARPSAWFHLDVPRHLCHFPAPVLRAQLERRGLVVERESYSAPEYDSFSRVQTWQNRMGLPHNLLFLTLKGAPAAAGTKPTAAERMAAVLLAVVMLPVAIVVTAWATWNRTGAVVTFLARKSRAPQAGRATAAGR
jgi:SAM-dependent methyltransferase